MHNQHRMILALIVAVMTGPSVATAERTPSSDQGYAVVDPYAHYRKHQVTDRTRYVSPRTQAVRSRVVYKDNSRSISGSGYSTYGDRTRARVVRKLAYAAPVKTYVETETATYTDEGVVGTVRDGVEDQVVLVQPYINSRRYAGYKSYPGYLPNGTRGYYGDGYSRYPSYPVYRAPVHIGYGSYNRYGHRSHSYGYGPSYGHGYSHGYGHRYGHGGYGRGYGYGGYGHGYGVSYGHYRGGHRSHSGVSFHFSF